LSNGWQYSFKELLDAARAGITTGNAGLSGPAGRPLAWQGFRPFVVKNATMESLDICSFQLASQDNAPLPPFQPGQHLAVKIQTGNQGKYLIRMYSICSPQNATTYRIAVKREQYGQASAWLHDHLKEGDVLEASAPRGTFTLLPGEGPVVLLGAGVGITPLLSMLYALQSSNTSRQVWWVYSVRDRHHHCFIEELRQIAADWPALHVVNIYSRPGSSGIKGVDFSCSGHLDADIIQSQKIPINADFYLCGPAQYLDDTTAMLRSLGAEENRIRFETFGLNISSINARPPHLPAKNNGAGPLLTFNKSNISFKWDPRFTSILDAAEACDIPVAWSCRMGVCHRCESALLDGNVQYLTQPLDLPSEGNILICCSIPASPITLDL
jgi:ferredoxin-NADP reductase